MNDSTGCYACQVYFSNISVFFAKNGGGAKPEPF
jgi:hypothetical protein